MSWFWRTVGKVRDWQARRRHERHRRWQRKSRVYIPPDMAHVEPDDRSSIERFRNIQGRTLQ